MLTKEAAPLLRKWVLLDATDQPLGRLASKIAYILQGKHRSAWTLLNALRQTQRTCRRRGTVKSVSARGYAILRL